MSKPVSDPKGGAAAFVPSSSFVAPPPDPSTLPTPPRAWQPANKRRRRTRNPFAAQKRNALQAAQEIAACTNYKELFGSTAPDQTTLANALGTASVWSDDMARMAAWIAWGRENEIEAWAAAFALLDPFQPVFEAALAANPKALDPFYALQGYFAAAHVHGERSAATRAARRRENEKAAEAQAMAAANPPESQPAHVPTESAPPPEKSAGG